MASRSTPTISPSDTAKTAVKALIGQKLLEQEVKKYDDKVDEAQVDKYIEQLRMDKHMSDAQFRAQLQASGMSYDDLRKHARLELEKAMMIEQEVRDKINVPDAEIQAYYDAHKADFTIDKGAPPARADSDRDAGQRDARSKWPPRRRRPSRFAHARSKGDDFGDLAQRIFRRRFQVQRRRARMVRARRHHRSDPGRD